MKVFRREIQLVILSLLVLTMEAIGQNEADFRQWNFDDGEKAFAKVLHCDFEIKDGVFSGVIEGNDVALILPFTDLEPPLRLKMRIRSGEGSFGRGEIYWRTDALQGFEHDRTAMYLMDHDWTWREYGFPIPAMEGPIQVRFDPGWKKGKVEIDWIRLEEDPIPESIRKLNESLPETLTISSDQLSLEMRPLKSEFEVTQKETGRIWTGSFSDLQGLVVEASAESPTRIQISLWDPATRQIYDSTIEFEEEHSLSFSLDTQQKDSTFWAFREWPPALESDLKEGKILFCDRSSGTYIDQDDEAYGGENLLVYGNTTCMDMPWIGLMESETGEGVMLLVESPADAEVALSTDSNELIWPQIRWKPSMDSFRYPRKAAYRFFDKGGYVAMAKDYREIARENGLLVTLEEKAKRRPLVHRLKGAPPVWGDTDGWEFVQQARTLGMSQGILSNVHHGLKDKSRVEDINALGFLTCEYDSFSDIQDGPTGFQKDDVEETAYHLRPGLGPKAGWTTQEGFSYYDRSSAFAVRALKTYVPFRMDEWKFNARFIDVSMAKELHEDYHPAHTFDRRQDLEYRREAFEYYRENFDVVIGTEHGNDWGVDLVDYTEGAAGGPFHWEKQGAWHSGYYTRPTSREDYSKKYLKYGVGYETSIPLWQLVYHDCVSGSYYWGDCAGFHYHVAPEIADRKDLFNLLYGTVPLFWRSNRAFDWPTNKDRFMESYHNTCHFHEAIAFDSLVDHRFLNEEGTLQETRFSSGGFAAINFGEAPISYESPDGEKLILAPRGFFAKADGFYQSRLWKEGMPQTRIEKEGFVRYQSPERTEIGGVDFQGTYTAFKVTDSRWQFALEDDTEYRIDLARLTGWEKDSKLTLLLLDDLGKTTQFSSPNIHDGDLIIRTREGEDCFALVRGEIPTESVIYPKKEIVQPHEKIVLSFSDPKARLHYTLDGSEPTVESPLFEDPFSLADSARVQVRPFKEGAPLIETASKDYRVAHTLLKTPVIHGSESAHFIETSVEGYDQLRLLVTDGGDDCWSDKASFGDPILIKRDGTEISLSDLSPNYYFLLYGHLTADKRENDENISIAGKKFEKGIGVSSTAEVIFDLGNEYKTFKSYVGIDDYNSTTPGESSRIG